MYTLNERLGIFFNFNFLAIYIINVVMLLNSVQISSRILYMSTKRRLRYL